MRKQLSIGLVLFFLSLGIGSAFASTINFNGGIPPGWTVHGSGAASPPTGDITTTGTDLQFGVIDNNSTKGAISMKPLAGLIPASGDSCSSLGGPIFCKGSWLTSAPLVATGAPISMDLNFLTSDGEGHPDFALVYLLQGGAPVATLYGAQTNEPSSNPNCNPFTVLCSYSPADQVLGVSGIPTSPGVTLTPYTDFHGNPCPFDATQACLDGRLAGPLPNGDTFGPTDFLGNGRAGSSGWVTSSFTPAAGTYRLLFIIGNANDNSVASALAIDNISGLTPGGATTPEPGTLLLMGTGLAGLITRFRRKV